VLYPPYICASCAQVVTSPVVIDSTPLHEGFCVINYQAGGPLYHPSYLHDLHLIALYDLSVTSLEPAPPVPPPLPNLPCADCGIRSTECSSCLTCSLSLCVGCQDRHRHLLHPSAS
jgi:hypothetical protein